MSAEENKVENTVQMPEINFPADKEVEIGRWTDGRKVYRRVIAPLYVAPSGYTHVNLDAYGIDNVHFFYSIHGSTWNLGPGGVYPVPYYSDGIYISAHFDTLEYKVTVQSKGINPGSYLLLVLEYVKNP